MGQPEEASPEEQQQEAGAEEASGGEERPEDEGEEEEAAYLDELPEPLLLRVLAELPAAELVDPRDDPQQAFRCNQRQVRIRRGVE